MERLRELVGVERSVSGVSQALHLVVAGMRPPVVGAMHVTCADESEAECANAFQQGFVRYFVPPLKFAEHSAFRLANLGGRYEWGSVRIAEQHFATEDSRAAYKLLVVKINAHVGVIEDRAGYRFGVMKRYRSDSTCCGALHQLLAGDSVPAVRDLGETFASEGKDRLAALQDDHRVDPAHRSLFAAVVSARLQARRAVLDAQDYTPHTPTRYLVVPCVTFNRAERDTEIVCGYYWSDDPPDHVEYVGLGDDPGDYRLEFVNGRAVVTDEQADAPRRARDHRQLVLEEWHRRMGQRRGVLEDGRLDRVERELGAARRDKGQSKRLLRLLLTVLAEVEPVSAAVFLFANGVAGIHHAFRAHNLARELEGSDEAMQILKDVRDRVDHLDPEHAEAMIKMLMEEYRR